MSQKMLYKLLAVLLIFTIVLTACATPTAAPTAAPTEAPVVTEVPVVTEAPTEAPKPSGKLLVWVQKINMEAWQATVLPAFQEMYPDVEIEFVNNSPQQVADDVGLCIQGGTGCPDMFVTGNEYGTKLVDLG
ncbi:hypothetical protein EG832_10430, partial [bacterium]|nr:hypothetical protein [bacterium]